MGRINEAATHFLAFRFYLPNRFPDRGSAILRTSKRGSGRLALLGVLGFHGRRFEHCERAARRGVHQGTLPRGSRVGQENCPAGRAKSYAAHNPHRKFLLEECYQISESVFDFKLQILNFFLANYTLQAN